MALNSFFSLLLLFSETALASTASHTFYAGAGALNRNSGAVATDATSSSKPLLAETYAQVSIAGFFDLGGNTSFSPDLHYTPIGLKESDTGETTRVLAFGARLNQTISSLVDLHFGPGLMFYSISGTGGTIDLSNGAGTSTFGRPDASATSTLVYWDLGAGYSLDPVRIEFSVWVAGALSSRRTLSPALTLSWGL